MGKKGKFYIVQADILPEAIRKTAKAKELLARGEVSTVNEAVDRVELSRSAFYKYKDGVFPIHEASQGKIITLSMLLEHRSGVLSIVLNTIAKAHGNILTINQGLPLQGMANATISLETAAMVASVDDLIDYMRQVDGVKKVELVGHN
ncbi:MAG: ACT domain-containing protein [Clostridia bacterium]|nr:ACT domain-containing protein [Clostridia bacterium]